MYHKIKTVALALLACFFVLVGNASAMDWTGITVDMTDVNSLFAIVVPALITVWGLRKVIKFANRS